MSPTTCPKCGRPVEAVPGEPVNFCTGCGCPVTSEAVRERIADLMLQGRSTADSRRSLPAAAGDSPRPVPAVYAARSG
jgi:hypothetical protein